jgi:hypothetical protein
MQLGRLPVGLFVVARIRMPISRRAIEARRFRLPALPALALTTIGSSTARLPRRRTDTSLCCGQKASPESLLKFGFWHSRDQLFTDRRATRSAWPPKWRAGFFQRAIGMRDSKPSRRARRSQSNCLMRRRNHRNGIGELLAGEYRRIRVARTPGPPSVASPFQPGSHRAVASCSRRRVRRLFHVRIRSTTLGNNSIAMRIMAFRGLRSTNAKWEKDEAHDAPARVRPQKKGKNLRDFSV